jgi:hypothetical protein
MNQNVTHLLYALRSGENRQTFGSLRTEDTEGGRYCLVGLACEVYRKVTSTGEWNGEYFKLDGVLYGGFPPHKVMQWYGFTMEEVDVLISRNDEEISFADLATHLEFEYHFNDNPS